MDILLLERVVPPALAWLEARHRVEIAPERALDATWLRARLLRCRAVVLPRKMVVTREFLERAPRLLALARMHAGTDNTDLEACRERSVEVVQARAAQVRSNAEYLLAALLMLYRPGIGLPFAGQRHADMPAGREINGSTIGLFGLASVAHVLAPMLKGLGARLIGYDPAVHASSHTWDRLNIRPVPLRELLASSDAVSLQVMYATRYKGFINDAVLAHCRPGQLWVGTSRSSMFDAPALARALADGRIASCVLDGAEAGFASRGTPLHTCANLFLTPRLGSHTREAHLRASWYVVHRLHEALQGTQAVPTGHRVAEPA